MTWKIFCLHDDFYKDDFYDSLNQKKCEYFKVKIRRLMHFNTGIVLMVSSTGFKKMKDIRKFEEEGLMVE